MRIKRDSISTSCSSAGTTCGSNPSNSPKMNESFDQTDLNREPTIHHSGMILLSSNTGRLLFERIFEHELFEYEGNVIDRIILYNIIYAMIKIMHESFLASEESTTSTSQMMDSLKTQVSTDQSSDGVTINQYRQIELRKGNIGFQFYCINNNRLLGFIYRVQPSKYQNFIINQDGDRLHIQNSVVNFFVGLTMTNDEIKSTKMGVLITYAIDEFYKSLNNPSCFDLHNHHYQLYKSNFIQEKLAEKCSQFSSRIDEIQLQKKRDQHVSPSIAKQCYLIHSESIQSKTDNEFHLNIDVSNHTCCTVS